MGGCVGSECSECLKFSLKVSEEATQSVLRVLRKMVPHSLCIVKVLEILDIHVFASTNICRYSKVEMVIQD